MDELRLPKQRRNDSGLALVVALLVTMISFIIVTAVLAQALHNVAQAGYMRRRLSAINAAEAGLNLYWKKLESTTLESLASWHSWQGSSSVWVYRGSDVASGPDAPTFLLRVQYFKENPCIAVGTTNARPCSSSGLTALTRDDLLTSEAFPPTVYAIVRSIGCVGVGTCGDAAFQGVSRALRTVMRLRSRYGGVSGSVTSSYLCLDQAANLVMEGDLYVLGTASGPPGWPSDCSNGVVVGPGDGLIIKQGNLYAADGKLDVGDQVGSGDTPGGAPVEIYGDVWASGPVRLGVGTSSATSCSQSGLKICVHGNVTGTTIAVGDSAFVEGDLHTCAPACPPPVPEFPKIVWDKSDWSTWIMNDNQTAAQALAALTAPVSRNVYHVTSSPCVINLGGTFTINVDIAIVGECSFEMNSSTKLLGSGTLLLMSVWPGTPTSPVDLPADPGCGGDGTGDATKGNGFKAGPRDIYMHNNPDTSGPKLFLYTPCSLKIDNNQNPVKGQLVSRFLWIKNQATVTLVSVSGGGGISLPGIVTGFSQDVRFITEISLKDALA